MAEIDPAPESEDPTTDAAEPTPLIEPAAPAEPTGDVPVTLPAEVPVETTVAEPTSLEPVVATADPAATPEVAAPPVSVPQASQHVVYVEAPRPPAKKGNRVIGSLLAIASAVVFAAVYAVILYLVGIVNHGSANFDFVGQIDFWVPVAAFAVGFIILVLIVNRAGWAAHVIGSLFVGVFVYFATAGGLLLIHATTVPSDEVGVAFKTALFSAVSISAALLAREVSLWVGFAIAARGRRVKARNVETREAYDQQVAAKRAEYERANAARIGAVPASSERVAYTPGSPE